MEIIISDNNKIKSNYNCEERILYSEYKGVFNKSLALEHFNAVEEFAQNQPILGVVADLTKLGGSFNGIIQYLEDKGFPKMMNFGLKAEALIISDDIMIKHLTKKLAKIVTSSNIEMGIFKSSLEAKKWLQTMIKS